MRRVAYLVKVLCTFSHENTTHTCKEKSKLQRSWSRDWPANHVTKASHKTKTKSHDHPSYIVIWPRQSHMTIQSYDQDKVMWPSKLMTKTKSHDHLSIWPRQCHMWPSKLCTKTKSQDHPSDQDRVTWPSKLVTWPSKLVTWPSKLVTWPSSCLYNYSHLHTVEMPLTLAQSLKSLYSYSTGSLLLCTPELTLTCKHNQQSHMILPPSHMTLPPSHMTLPPSHMILPPSHMTLPPNHMTLHSSTQTKSKFDQVTFIFVQPPIPQLSRNY